MKPVTIILFLIIVGHPAVALAQGSKSKVEKIFHDYVQLNTIFVASAKKDSPSKKAYQDLRRAVETYAEDVYNPILEEAVFIVCNTRDKQILSGFFQVIVHTRNSADEYPTFVLGEMFICQTEIFTEIFKELPAAEKIIIYETAEWGFKNITYQKESEISDYSELKQKLEKLKTL